MNGYFFRGIWELLWWEWVLLNIGHDKGTIYIMDPFHSQFSLGIKNNKIGLKLNKIIRYIFYNLRDVKATR